MKGLSMKPKLKMLIVILTVMFFAVLTGCITMIHSESAVPFYQYIDKNGNLQLELYYDEESKKGSVVRYWDKESTDTFLIKQCDGQSWFYPDFSDSEYGSLVETDMVDVDENMRLLYTNTLVDEGSKEGYYIYLDDNIIPAYYLQIDIGSIKSVALYKVQQNKENWFYTVIEQEEQEDYTSDEELLTEEEWLKKYNFGESNLFYEYHYALDDSIPGEYITHKQVTLSLYCDVNMEHGGGILKEEIEGGRIQKLAFTFDGNEKYITWDVDPLKVFSQYYLDGRNVIFLKSENIVEYNERLDKIYGDTFFKLYTYEEEKLLHMIEDNNHGRVERFYIYKQDWEGNQSDTPRYMLELDPGWGVTLYSFEFYSDK